MGNNSLPLEHLAAFAIVFAAGVLSTIAFGKYIEKIKRDTLRDVKAARTDLQT